MCPAGWLVQGRGWGWVWPELLWVLQCRCSRRWRVPNTAELPDPVSGMSPTGQLPGFSGAAPSSTYSKTESAPVTAVALTQKPQIFSVSQRPEPQEQRVEGKERWMSDCHSCPGGWVPLPHPNPHNPKSQNS